MNEDLHIPWDRKALKKLITDLVGLGEATKVDLKSIFDLSNNQKKSEFLKDVSAMANTYNHNYKNHGFIIFGASDNKVTPTSFPNTEDHLQATIDELINANVGPFIETHLYLFKEKDGESAGVLVVPPTRNAPHIFIKDIGNFHPGDIFVRNGTTTKKAQPGDFPRFFRQQLEEHTFEFQQNINDLERTVLDLQNRLNLLEAPSLTVETKKDEPLSTKKSNAKPLTKGPISLQIDHLLAKDEDVIRKGLFEEVRKLNNFLDSNEIPWAIQKIDKKTSEDILIKIEQHSAEFWSAIISLCLADEKGVYEDLIIKSVASMSKQFEVPPGISYNSLGENIRYYPLFVTLYLVTILGVVKGKSKLLKRIFQITLKSRSRYEDPTPIAYVLFMMHHASDLFQPFHSGYPNSKWCDAVASYTKGLIDKILNPDDPLWDKDEEYYRGEFTLSLFPLDIVNPDDGRQMVSYPSSGLYLYFSSAVPIISRFLKEDRELLAKIYDRPLEKILSDFDEAKLNSQRSVGCFMDGFTHGARDIAFPEKKEEAQANE